MQPRDVARVGAGSLVVMHALFLVGGLERGAVYVMFQLAGGAACAWAAARPERPSALGVMFGALALVRLGQVALDLSRLPLWLNLTLSALMLVAMGACVAWNAAPQRAAARAALVRAATWALAVLFFVAMVSATGGGHFSAMGGLLLGTIGFSLVAPNVGAAAPASTLGEVRQQVVPAEDAG